MSTEYTPTLNEWRESFHRFLARHKVDDPEELVDELDRVIAAHDARIKAEAKAEGLRDVIQTLDEFTDDELQWVTGIGAVRDISEDLKARVARIEKEAQG